MKDISINKQVRDYVEKTQPTKKINFDALVFIGRFQPFHNGHKAVIDAALKEAKEVIVVVGSSFSARNIRNPFTFQERKDMIKSVFADKRVKVVPVSDYPYDDNKWIAAIQNVVHGAIASEGWTDFPPKIGLIGHSKDSTSYYLNIFPTWGNVEVANVDGINATDIRKGLFDKRHTASIIPMKKYMPQEVANLIGKFMFTGKKKCRDLEDGRQQWYDEKTEEFSILFKEYQMVKEYKEAWEAAPYPPTFMTTDAVVVQSGHILLVKRGAMPGKGLLALPGGFLNQEETMLDGCIRELKEETKIKVPVPVLKGSIKESKTFDAPNRSVRGRTITQAFFIDLGTGELPKVKGSDDAEKAMWVPFKDVKQELMFEDHFHIIDTFVPIG